MRSVKTVYREAGRCYRGQVALFAPVLKVTLRVLIILDCLEKNMQAEQGNPAFLPDKHPGLFFPASPRLLMAPCKPDLQVLWLQVVVASGFFPISPPED